MNTEPGSLDWNAKDAVVRAVGVLGPCEIVVSGASPTVKSHSAGSSPGMPNWSIPRTWKTCRPGSICSIRYGVSHDSNGSASSAHSYSTAPIAENSKIGFTFVDGFVGALRIVVSGAGTGGSYVHVQVAGVGSTFRARSTARAWKV